MKGEGDDPLPAHRIALRVALSTALAGTLAGAVSAAPFLAVHRDDWHVWLATYNALWIATRSGLLILGEESVRASGAVVRVIAVAALLLLVSPLLENWAMHWMGTMLGQGIAAFDPIAGLRYALERVSIPVPASSVGWEQLRMTAPFLALAVARTRLDVWRSAGVALAVGALAFSSSLTPPVSRPATAIMMFVLPAPSAALALELARRAERWLVDRRRPV